MFKLFTPIVAQRELLHHQLLELKRIIVLIPHPYYLPTLIKNLPRFYLIEKNIYDTKPDTLWRFYTMGGIFVFLNDTTFTFTPYHLDYNTEYIAITNDLKVINQTDTLITENTNITFKTVLLAHHLIYSNLDGTGGYYRCGDTLTFKFNRSIDSLTTWLGDVISIMRIDSTKLDTLGEHKYTSKVATTNWFNNDSTELFLLPHSYLNSDYLYYIADRLGFINGDLLDIRDIPLLMRTRYKISLNINTNDSTDTLQAYEHFYNMNLNSFDNLPNDTILLIPHKYFGMQKFVHWLCIQDTSINNTSSDTLKISKNCSNLVDLYITALYSNIPNDTLTVYDTTGITIKIYDYEGNYLGGSGKYYIKENERIFIHPLLDTNYQFFYWESNIEQFDSTTNIDLEFTAGQQGTNFIFRPHIGNSGCSTYSLTITVSFLNRQKNTQYTINNVISVTPFMNSTRTSRDPMIIEVDALINRNLPCDCHRIAKVVLDGQILLNDVCNPTVDNWNTMIYVYNPCHRLLQIYVDVRRVYLEADMVVDGNGILSKNPKNYLYISPLPDKPIKNCNEDMNQRKLISHIRDDNKDYYYLRYPCGDNIHIEPKYNDEYTFKTYNTNVGYYSPPIPLNKNLNINPICYDYTLSNNSKIQAILNSDFRLIKIGIPTDPNHPTELQYFDPEAIWSDFENQTKKIQLSDFYIGIGNRKSANIEFVFNHPVNTSYQDKIYCKDKSNRIDNFGGGSKNNDELKHLYYGSIATTLYYDNYYGEGVYQWSESNTKFTLALYIHICFGDGTGMTCHFQSVPKLENIIFYVGNIQSASGQTIKNPHADNKLTAWTEFPSISGDIYSFKINKTGNFNTITLSAAEVLYKNDAMKQEYVKTNFLKKFPQSTNYDNVQGNAEFNANYNLFNYQLEYTYDNIDFGYCSYSIHNGSIFNNTGVISSSTNFDYLSNKGNHLVGKIGELIVNNSLQFLGNPLDDVIEGKSQPHFTYYDYIPYLGYINLYGIQSRYLSNDFFWVDWDTQMEFTIRLKAE